MPHVSACKEVEKPWCFLSLILRLNYETPVFLNFSNDSIISNLFKSLYDKTVLIELKNGLIILILRYLAFQIGSNLSQSSILSIMGVNKEYI